MRIRVAIGVALALVLFSGCTSSYESADNIGGSQDTGSTEDDTSDSDTAMPDAERLRLSGTLEIQEGVFSGGQLEFSLYSQGPERQLVCTQTQLIAAVSELATADPQWIFHWADVDLEPPDSPCQATLPTTLRVGLGPLYPEIVPHLDSYGVAEVQDSLQGFYLAVDAPWGSGLSADPYAIGYAGTQAQLEGQDQAATGAPMPQGSYLVQAVYLLALD